jgi:hypothetical protein
MVRNREISTPIVKRLLSSSTEPGTEYVVATLDKRGGHPRKVSVQYIVLDTVLGVGGVGKV